MELNDAANILAGFINGSSDVAETVLINAGYSQKQIEDVRNGFYIGQPAEEKPQGYKVR